MKAIYNPDRELLAAQVVNRMDTLNIPDNIIIEFNEQYIFMSRGKLEAMKNWSYEQFTDWYNS